MGTSSVSHATSTARGSSSRYSRNSMFAKPTMAPASFGFSNRSAELVEKSFGLGLVKPPLGGWAGRHRQHGQGLVSEQAASPQARSDRVEKSVATRYAMNCHFRSPLRCSPAIAVSYIVVLAQQAITVCTSLGQRKYRFNCFGSSIVSKFL